MVLQPGSVLHQRYRIERQLGKGGMGAVYPAFDERLQINVAVKENLSLNPESERQFLREARLLASLHHPNLPRVTDYFVLEGRQYLVMDYIEGEDLHSRAGRQPPTVSEVIQWADAIGDALAYLHSRQPPVIHRDVKPSNLKLQSDGNVVLVDFGIAKIFDQSATTSGARGLTPGFSPPEQYGGTRTDARSDQYSLAATLYCLLTGRAPADSIERMLNHEQLRPARAYNPAVPDFVEAALERALSIEQDQRFPDILTFVGALHGQTIAPTVRAPARAGLSRAGTAGRGSRWLLFGGLGAVGLVLLAGAAAFLGGVIGPQRSPTPSPMPTRPMALAPTPTPSPKPVTPEPSPTPEPTVSPEPSPTASPAPTLIGGGGRIAFVSDRGEERILQIWTMNPDGSDWRQLTFGPGNKSQPRWSPDGARLLFVAPGGDSNGLDIWLMNADGTGRVNLTQFPGDDTDPAWSPDGLRLAFASTRFTDFNRVYIMELTCEPPPGTCSPGQLRIAGNYAAEDSPAWHPLDPDTLIVAGSINQARNRILVRSLEAGDPPRYFDLSDTLMGASDLRFSPDGQWILFAWRRPGSYEIYVVRWDDPRTFIRLTNTAGNKEPAYSPDGLFIAFTSTRDQNPEIYRMTVNGADEVNLTQSPSTQEMQPDWQPVP
ncbi:MAG: protein kinase [Chloroflexota bacterium]